MQCVLLNDVVDPIVLRWRDCVGAECAECARRGALYEQNCLEERWLVVVDRLFALAAGDEIVYTSLGSLVSNKAAVLQHPIYAY